MGKTGKREKDCKKKGKNAKNRADGLDDLGFWVYNYSQYAIMRPKRALFPKRERGDSLQTADYQEKK